MKIKHDLAFLVPTRNRDDLLGVALASIRDVFGDGTKVILGNNGNHAKTAEFLEQNNNFDLSIDHFGNPENSTYVYNLKALLDRSTTKWVSFLHDDDFFTCCPERVSILLEHSDADFIFTDHWIASNDGVVDEEETDKNSRRYGRWEMATGPVDDLVFCAVAQRICLDGFFIRRDLATRGYFQTSSAFGDSRWLIQVCSLSKKSEYLRDRTFAYRLSLVGLTALGLRHIDCLQALLDAADHVTGPQAKKALKKKIFRQMINTLRYCVKRGKISGFYSVAKAAFRLLKP